MSKVNQLGQYKGLTVQVKKRQVQQTEIDQQIQTLVAQNPLLIEKKGEVEHGDVTTIDFEGFKDGVAFDGGKANGYQLEIGSGKFIPGFEDQMIGMRKGETKDLNLTFPANYGVADLAGADVIFKVTVHKIERKKEAQLNDEFVASLNVANVKTVADLQEYMKTNIQAHHDQAYRTDVENALFAKLIENCHVDVNEEDINTAMKEHIEHIRVELARQGMELEQYLQMMGMNEEALRHQLQPAAKQQAIFEAIIDEIIRVEKIETTDNEVNQQIETIMQQNQMSKEDILSKVSITDLKRDYNRLKSSQLIIQSAIVTE